MKKNLWTFIISLVVVATGSFYGGIKYSQSKNLGMDNFNKLTAEQRQARFIQGNETNTDNAMGIRTGMANGGLINGEVLSKDDKSITVKLADGGSKIVFYSDSTVVSKSATTTMQDLTVGENVMVSGTTNQDGSISAQMVQIRPDGAPMPEQGQPRPQ